MRLGLILCIFGFLGQLCQTCLYADTVRMKNGEVRKGLITETYPDRIVLRQASGDVHLLRSQITEIQYVDKYKNDLSEGERYFEQKKYDLALKAYERALKENPNSREVQDAILKLRGILFREKEVRQKRNLEKRKQLGQWQSSAQRKNALPVEEKEETPADQVWQELGLRLEKTEDGHRLKEIRSSSPASQVHLFAGDLLLKVWGKQVKFEPVEKAYALLRGEEYSDVRIAIQRKLVLIRQGRLFFQSPFQVIGAELEFESAGLIVQSVDRDSPAQLGGLKLQDQIVFIDGEPTKYMSKDSLKGKILGESGSRVELIVMREVLLRRL